MSNYIKLRKSLSRLLQSQQLPNDHFTIDVCIKAATWKKYNTNYENLYDALLNVNTRYKYVIETVAKQWLI